VDNIRKNAEFNLTAAQLLYEKEVFSPCVHCAYFSSFQLMKFVIKDFFAIDYIQQERELQEQKKQKALLKGCLAKGWPLPAKKRRGGSSQAEWMITLRWWYYLTNL